MDQRLHRNRSILPIFSMVLHYHERQPFINLCTYLMNILTRRFIFSD